jgi:hypothetical protein
MDDISTANLKLSFKKPNLGALTIRFSNSKGNYMDVGS